MLYRFLLIIKDVLENIRKQINARGAGVRRHVVRLGEGKFFQCRTILWDRTTSNSKKGRCKVSAVCRGVAARPDDDRSGTVPRAVEN